jgi:hypothetical protein
MVMNTNFVVIFDFAQFGRSYLIRAQSKLDKDEFCFNVSWVWCVIVQGLERYDFVA